MVLNVPFTRTIKLNFNHNFLPGCEYYYNPQLKKQKEEEKKKIASELGVSDATSNDFSQFLKLLKMNGILDGQGESLIKSGLNLNRPGGNKRLRPGGRRQPGGRRKPGRRRPTTPRPVYDYYDYYDYEYDQLEEDVRSPGPGPLAARPKIINRGNPLLKQVHQHDGSF